jgi:hypothetical protein
MGTFIFLQVLIVVVIVAVVMIARRARKSEEWDGKGTPTEAQFRRISERMPSGEAMYAMSFPDIAPLFKPDLLLEWQAWYLERRKNKQIIRDGRRWHGQVPGFPDAATMSVKGEKENEDSAELVVLQNQAGETLVEMVVESRADGSTTLTTDAGSFLIKPSADSKVRFTGTERSFEWKGPGNWRFQTPVGAAPMQAQGGTLQAESSPGIGAAGVVGGVAAGAVVGVLAQKAWDARAAKEKARQEQRASRLDTNY